MVLFAILLCLILCTCLHLTILTDVIFILQTDPDFDLDIRDDVQEECSKFGQLRHIFVDK